jgi:hypothetical protein
VLEHGLRDGVAADPNCKWQDDFTLDEDEGYDSAEKLFLSCTLNVKACETNRGSDSVFFPAILVRAASIAVAG